MNFEIGRAFTTRRNKYTDKTPTPAMPIRSASARRSGTPELRNKISAPIALISTTNMLSYTAPNIRSSSSSSTTSASSESEVSPTSSHSSSTSVSLDSPPTSPQPNHLSVYFPPSGRLSSASGWSSGGSPVPNDAPPVPKRAVSHTAKSHMLAHTRSQKRRSPNHPQPPTSLDKITSDTNTIRSSRDMFSANSDAPHPFGKELEQVNELAEEYGLQSSVIDQEEMTMRQKGLLKFGVEDYVLEIVDLYGGVFEDEMPLFTTGWI